MHSIVTEGSLIDFSSPSYSASPPVDLTFSKVSLKERVVRVNFETVAIWPVSLVCLASVHCSRFPLIKVKAQIFIDRIFAACGILKVIEGSKFLVNVLYLGVTDLFKHITIVIKAERVVHSLKNLIDPLSDIDFDLCGHQVYVIYLQFPLRKVNTERFKFVLKVINVLLDVLLIVIKLKQAESGQR